MDYLKNVFGKKQIRFLIISGISLIAGLLVLFIGIKLSQSLKAENMAERWGDSKEFTQVSVFYSELAGIDENVIKSLAYGCENKLKEDSITANDGARLMVYAYSAIGKINISSNTVSKSVKAIGVGGDFFLFHPVELIYGSVFSGDNLNDDLVVIDRETSFYLFGSTDVVGQIVEINGTPFVISGVIERDSGRLNRLAGNSDPIVYLSYSAVKDAGMHINMFEVLMPNPVTGYAKNYISDNAASDEQYCEVVENTGRFYFTKLLKNATKYGTRSMNSKGIVYPYWENMARGMEDYLTPLAVAGLVLFLIPAFCVIYTIGRMWKFRTIRGAEIKDFIERLIEKSREKRNRKKAKAHTGIPVKNKKEKKPKKEKSPKKRGDKKESTNEED